MVLLFVERGEEVPVIASKSLIPKVGFGAFPTVDDTRCWLLPRFSREPRPFLLSAIARIQTFCSCNRSASAEKDAPA